MTLDDVAQACSPPTTPQTIGRLETGTRTVSIGWLNRIADALGVDAAELVEGGGDKAELPVRAVLGANGAPPRSGPASWSRRGQKADKSRSPSPRATATIAPATKSGATRSGRKASQPLWTRTCLSLALLDGSSSAG